MPEEALVDEPVVAATEVEPEPQPFTLPEDFAQQVQSWDVPLEDLPTAVEAYKRFQTEQGVIDGFVAFGQQLGFGLKDLNKLFVDEQPVAAPTAAPTPAAPPPDPDALLTRAEMDAEIARIREEQQSFVQQQQTAQQEAHRRQVISSIEQWFDEKGIKDETTRSTIAGMAQKHVLPTQDADDPRVYFPALERGLADHAAWVEQEVQGYLKKKGASATSQPTPIGGSVAGTTGNEETPIDYAAARGGAFQLARDRVRARMRELGELGQ